MLHAPAHAVDHAAPRTHGGKSRETCTCAMVGPEGGDRIGARARGSSLDQRARPVCDCLPTPVRSLARTPPCRAMHAVHREVIREYRTRKKGTRPAAFEHAGGVRVSRMTRRRTRDETPDQRPSAIFLLHA